MEVLGREQGYWEGRIILEGGGSFFEGRKVLGGQNYFGWW